MTPAYLGAHNFHSIVLLFVLLHCILLKYTENEFNFVGCVDIENCVSRIESSKTEWKEINYQKKKDKTKKCKSVYEAMTLFQWLSVHVNDVHYVNHTINKCNKSL